MRRDPDWSSFYVEHEPVVFVPEGPSRTRQEFKDECDINTIMARYEQTGVISHFNDGVPQYLDMTDMPYDLADTLKRLQEAEGAFMRLPAHVRREFDNDPVQFVAFAEQPSNLDQMIAWGLAPPREPTAMPEPPADDPPSAK